MARFIIGLACIAALGCGPHSSGPNQPSTAADDAILCLVAASTRESVQEIAAAFTADTGVNVKLVADDSAKLATQLVHDAPADLFLSANEKWAQFIQEHGFAQTITPLLGNSLVLVVPRDNPAQVAQPADLTKPAVQRVAVAGPTVPAGVYARQALTRLKLWDALEKANKIVTGENVRSTLTFVERGEVEAGIVYATDAKITDRVQAVHTFAPALHEPIIYPLVLTKAGARKENARKFHDYLQSAQAAAIFRKHGFIVLDAK